MSTRTDLLSTLPTTVAAEIKLALPGLRECKGIAGRFNLERLKSESVKAPAILISILDLKQTGTMTGPVHHFDLSMAAFIVTKDVMGLPRDEAAAVLCHELCRIIPDHHWNDADCGEAKEVRGQSVVSKGLQGLSAALWAVTWTQPCVVNCPDPGVILPIDLYLGLEPNTGAANVGNYTKIGGDP